MLPVDPIKMVLDSLLEAYFRQIERPQPQEHNIRSVNRWLSGNKPFTAEESSFLSEWNDLTAPTQSVTHTALETIVEACATRLHSRGFSTVCMIYFLSLNARVKVTCADVHHEGSISNEHHIQYDLTVYQHDAMKSTDRHLIYITAHRIVLATRLLTSVAAIALLILPIILLYSLGSMTTKLIIIAVFASFFTFFLSLISHARVIEVFSATAA